MPAPIILASGSSIRAQLLRNAGVPFEQLSPRVDEDALKDSLLAEGITPRDLADALAEAKSAKLGRKHPEAITIGCDQTLDFKGDLFNKPTSPDEVTQQLTHLSGQTHHLHSAVVLYHDGAPIWRHIGTARLTMHRLSPDFISDYATRNWDSIQYSVGGYIIEGEGLRLMARVEGDTFTIQGLPMIPLLSYLAQRGTLPL